MILTTFGTEIVKYTQGTFGAAGAVDVKQYTCKAM